MALSHVKYKRPWPVLSQVPPRLVRYACLKQFHIPFSNAASLLRCSLHVCSLKFHRKCFFLNVYCMSCWIQLPRNPQPSCRGFVNIGTDASKLRDSQERRFIVMLKLTHPAQRCYERARMLYRVCSLNFHRLSRYRSHRVATGCISKATCNL